MFAVIVCLAGILAILLVGEYLWRLEILKGEAQRKFVHIASAAFIASWPWLVSWKTITWLGVAMVAVLLINRRLKTLHYLGEKREEDYGDVFLALAISACALLTDVKVFFALALLVASLADGLAAIVGSKYGTRWRYKVFHQTKTVIGSMTFWFTTLCILGVGVLFEHATIPLSHYAVILLVVPPVLTMLENVAVLGLDNAAVPIAVIIALKIAQVG